MDFAYSLPCFHKLRPVLKRNGGPHIRQALGFFVKARHAATAHALVVRGKQAISEIGFDIFATVDIQRMFEYRFVVNSQRCGFKKFLENTDDF